MSGKFDPNHVMLGPYGLSYVSKGKLTLAELARFDHFKLMFQRAKYVFEERRITVDSYKHYEDQLKFYVMQLNKKYDERFKEVK